ncbi:MULTISPECIES: sugar ABC transporter ATP-binding protein [unclassified Nocardioides]|uniref:sugar ABC transporter ATP-binding protein n=1 Tax=unclassified Nocardioides TaxID=2615069 RepID=UPI000A9AFDC0|nr:MULTISPECIES: sugar ABC transporter ATP-binding protein [unclassified Nocardioides]
MTLDTNDKSSSTAFELVASGIGKMYGPIRVLGDVSFQIGAGEVVGLIGANGAGKSTLIKCLTGAVRPTEGAILIDGEGVTFRTPDEALSVGVAAVPQEVTIPTDRPVAETVLLGRFPSTWGFTSRSRVNAAAKTHLDRVHLADVNPNRDAGSLTPTQKRLVMVAAVLARDPKLVILDEPTAALPPEESSIVHQLVRELSVAGVAVVYVSHRLHEVKDLCTRVVALRNGRLAGELHGEDITRHAMLGLIGGTVEPDTLLVSEEHSHHEVREVGDTLLDVNALSGIRIQDVSFTVRRGEILGIAGLAGSGRSELLRLIYGLQAPTAGEITYDGRKLSGGPRARMRRKLGYVTELRSNNMLKGLSVARNMTCNSVGDHKKFGLFADAKWEHRAAEATGRTVSLVGAPSTFIENLSGGNIQKVLIGRWLSRETELLLLDEPTSGVDLVARKEIHDVLHEMTERGTSVVVASVEVDELTTICDRVLVLVEGRVVATLQPPFSEAELVATLFEHQVAHSQSAEAV